MIKPKGEPCYDSIPSAKPSRNPFRLLAHTDIIILLFLNAIVCAVFYAFTATISTLFIVAYPYLSETEIGLCFLAIGGGMAIGSSLNGKILDWEYREFSKKLKVGSQTVDEEPSQKHHVSSNFPIEKVRSSTVF